MQCTLYFAVKIFFRHIPIEVLQAGNYIQIRMSIRAGMIRGFFRFFLFVFFVAIGPKSTAMVMVGRSVHLTTLFPGQA